MSSTLSPYLSFRDDARQAMEFYASVLGGEPQIMTFGAMGTEGPEADKVMHSQLTTTLGYTFMASDTPEGMDFQEGQRVTLAITGDDEEAMTGYFHALAEGGTVTLPLEKQMWGATFGMLVDRFGIAWMVNIGG